ncbi:D-sedoheptulose 7-phosphate isomerase [Acidobacteriota bacterium]
MTYRKDAQHLTETLDRFLREKQETLDAAIDRLCRSLQDGRKIMICGNGGSASQAQHFAAEIVIRFRKDRKALSAVALSTDTSILTSAANDFSFDVVFSRQVEALGRSGDVLIGLSTSGNSANVLEALKTARNLGMDSIALTGRRGGKVGSQSDFLLDVPSDSTPRIQEVHLFLLHTIAGEIESRLT